MPIFNKGNFKKKIIKLDLLLADSSSNNILLIIMLIAKTSSPSEIFFKCSFKGLNLRQTGGFCF